MIGIVVGIALDPWERHPMVAGDDHDGLIQLVTAFEFIE